MKVLIAAGGTAGHLFPAQQLAKLLSDCEVYFAGHGLHTSPYFQKNFRFQEIAAAPIGLRFFFFFLRGLTQSIRLFWKEKPDVVVGFGSYHTIPLLCAAVLFRKKIVLYEPNRTIGKVNQLFSPFATRIAVQFLTGSKYTQKCIQIPLFPWIQKQAPEKKEARISYGLDPSKKTVLVFGGSQGAKFLNERLPSILHSFQVIHLAGNEPAATETAAKYRQAGIQAVVKPFESNMAAAYAAADFAICRSGAATIAELIRYSLPSILIPYPYAYGHQEFNARYLENFGGGAVLLEQNATPEEILKQIQSIDLEAMRVALRSKDEQNKSFMGLDEWVRRSYVN